MKSHAIGVPCPHCAKPNLVMNCHQDFIQDTTCTICKLPIMISYFQNKNPTASKRTQPPVKAP